LLLAALLRAGLGEISIASRAQQNIDSKTLSNSFNAIEQIKELLNVNERV